MLRWHGSLLVVDVLKERERTGSALHPLPRVEAFREVLFDPLDRIVRFERVPPGKSVVAGQATFRYSWMRPSHLLVRRTVTVAEVASGGSWTGVGGCWPRDWWGRCWLWWAM